MKHLARICSGLLMASILSGCAPHAQASSSAHIISLDYCADQYVLSLVDRAHILALSANSQKSFSALRARAISIPHINDRAENILALHPKIIVRSFGGSPALDDQLVKAGVKIIHVPWVDHLKDIEPATLEMARQLGVPLPDDVQAIFERSKKWLDQPLSSQQPNGLYITDGGASAGKDTIVDEIMVAAGIENMVTEHGWPSIDIEQLISMTPEIVIKGKFDSADQWQFGGHGLVRSLLAQRPTLKLDGALTGCVAPQTLLAVPALTAQLAQLKGRGQ